jgi:alpha-amylase
MQVEGHVSLGLVLHNHQPVGQSDQVFEEIYEVSYEPIVAALERHPGVRCGLHYTGSLYDWLFRHRPEYIERIRTLVAREQVEVLSGGYYEPILPAIPDDDKRGQILKMTETVRRVFGYDPTGMWLAERVWEPTLPTSLAAAGIGWTVVDDNHFKMVGLTDDDLHGYYVTEDNGNMVNVFGTSRQLRYTIPWRPVEETIEFMREQASLGPGRVMVMGDDGEKFGAWPDTYEHCWGTTPEKNTGWVDDFFTALEDNAEWLHTVRLADFVRHIPAVGRIYLPTASYNEMMEWALPSERSREFSELYHALEKEENPAAGFMRGGFWRNFLVKYPEANTQHKKMLRVHDLLVRAAGQAHNEAALARLDAAREDLWSGQSNDTYWHGLFGGVYLTDIRVRVQAHLLRAQAAAEREIYGDGNRLGYDITDFDRDSLHELLVEGNALDLYFDMADGGSIFEWDLRPHNYNLASTVSRRPEAYHAALRRIEQRRRDAESQHGAGGDPQAMPEGEVLSPHEAMRVKEPGLDRFLNYDTYRKACLIDHFLGPGTTLENFRDGQYNEEGDFVTGAYKAEIEQDGRSLQVILTRDGHVTTETGPRNVRVAKRVIMLPGSSSFRVKYTIENNDDGELTAVFGSEWNINLLGGGHNPSAYYRVAGVDLEDAALDSTGEVRNVTEMAVGNSWLEIEMGLSLTQEATLWRFPIETVSGSEAGFERTYQGSCILLQWLLKLPPGESADIELMWTNQGSTQSALDRLIDNT